MKSLDLLQRNFFYKLFHGFHMTSPKTEFCFKVRHISVLWPQNIITDKGTFCIVLVHDPEFGSSSLYFF